MREVQQILWLIVNDLERTSAGLDALNAQLKTLAGTRTVASRNALSLAIQRNAGIYRGIRDRINAITAGRPS